MLRDLPKIQTICVSIFKRRGIKHMVNVTMSSSKKNAKNSVKRKKSSASENEVRKGKFTLFYKKESPFSQHHPCKFTVDDLVYNCAEQYMMHQKAVTFGDKKMAEAIIKETCPKAMKKFGRKVSNFEKDVWANKSKDIVKRASIAKFSQNKHLRDALFKTSGTTLAEAAPRDRLWGIGLGANNPKAQDKANWRGKNLLGYILTEVREELMAKDKAVEEETED